MKAMAPDSLVALDGCRIERWMQSRVEVVEASARNRAFPDRVTESLGLCLKFGAEHDVKANGKVLRYPRDSVCVRTPGCVWSSAETGNVGFLSIDIEADLLPVGLAPKAMRFLAPEKFPDLRTAVAILRSQASPLEKDAVVADLMNALLSEGLFESLEEGSRHRTVERARELLTSGLSESLSLQELAQAVGANRFVLLRDFRKQFGVPPHAFLLRLRVERARTLLARGQGIAEVAHDLGFADQSHLNRTFKRFFGLSPATYRSQARSV